MRPDLRFFAKAARQRAYLAGTVETFRLIPADFASIASRENAFLRAPFFKPH